MTYANYKNLIILDADGTTIDAYSAIEKTFSHHGMNLGDEESFQKRHHIFKYLGGIKQFPANIRKNITKHNRQQIVETLTEEISMLATYQEVFCVWKKHQTKY